MATNSVTLCFNNPNYRNWLLGAVEDYARSYEIDGIMWGSEREGAFSNMLRGTNPRTVTCFCQHCQAKARTRGVDVGRARAGFEALAAFVEAGRQNKRPIDGYYVTLWRLMLRYPELLAWEMLWTDSLRETYAAMYQRVKSIKPAVGVGWHIWHNNSFSPIYRAEQDLSELHQHSDFLKMVMYHNCGGERMAGYIRNVGRTMFADLPQQESLDFHYRVLGYTQEKPLDRVGEGGLLGQLRLRRGQARARGAEWDEDAALAGHRYRHSDRCELAPADHARGDARGRAGGVPRGVGWRAAVAEIFGDADGESPRGGGGGTGVRVRVNPIL